MNPALQELKVQLQKLNLEPKKSLSQNFLVNPNLCQKIVQKARNFNPSFYIEVGPGLGALTQFLEKKSSLLIEKDSTLAHYWKTSGFHVLEKNALTLDFKNLNLPSGCLLLSNLPYQISSRLFIERSLKKDDPIEFMVLMFQKEVAEKILSQHNKKTYGILSIMSSVFWESSFLLEAYPKDFYPAPKVASQVLCFKRKPSPTIKNEKEAHLFLNLLKKAFCHRRKYLKKNLGLSGAALENLGFSPQSRADNLKPQDFIKLFCYLKSENG